MQVIDLMQQIKNNNLSHYYIFTGSEFKIMQEYLAKMLKQGYTFMPCETVKDAVQLNNRRTLDNSKFIYMVYEDKAFEGSESWDKVKELFQGGNNILILRYFNLTKNHKFYTSQKDWIVEFEFIGEDVLDRYLQKLLPGLAANRRAILIEICGKSYGRILSETNKILMFDSTNFNIAFDELADQNLLAADYRDQNDMIFKLTDSIVSLNKQATEKYLVLAKQKNESVLAILSILYTSYNNLYSVQTNDTKQLKDWQVRKAQNLCKAYTPVDIKYILNLLRKAEFGIKIGTLDEAVALDYVILNIFY